MTMAYNRIEIRFSHLLVNHKFYIFGNEWRKSNHGRAFLVGNGTNCIIHLKKSKIVEIDYYGKI